MPAHRIGRRSEVKCIRFTAKLVDNSGGGTIYIYIYAYIHTHIRVCPSIRLFVSPRVRLSVCPSVRLSLCVGR